MKEQAGLVEEKERCIPITTSKNTIARAKTLFREDPGLTWIICEYDNTLAGQYEEQKHGDLLIHRNGKATYTDHHMERAKTFTKSLYLLRGTPPEEEIWRRFRAAVAYRGRNAKQVLLELMEVWERENRAERGA